MKKVHLLLLVLGLSAGSSQAQTFSEWFRQKRTQLKYLREQIAALIVFGSEAKEGYRIAEKGLSLIGGETGMEFGLHRDYFTSLRNINPSVKDDGRVGDIVQWESYIMKKARMVRRDIQGEHMIQADHKTVLDRVIKTVTAKSLETVEELTLLLTPDALELTDDQRLERLGALFDQSVERLVFLESFGNDLARVLKDRQRTVTYIQNLKKLYRQP